MKKILLHSILAIVLSSCASHDVMTNITKQLPPLEEDDTVVVYDRGDTVPINSEILGEVFIIRNCDWETMMEFAKKLTRAAGGNGLEIQSHVEADRYSKKNKRIGYAISAYFLNVNDSITPIQPTTFEKKDFHDYAVLKEGDTIPCLMLYESNSHLQFVYDYGRQGYRKSMSIPKSDFVSYHIKDSVAFAEQQQRYSNFKLFSTRFAIDGGFFIYNGFNFSGNIQFCRKNYRTLGVHFDYCHGYLPLHQRINDADYYIGYIDNDNLYKRSAHPNIFFIAGSFGVYLPDLSKRQEIEIMLDCGSEFDRNDNLKDSMKKRRLLCSLLAGYIYYQENGNEGGLDYTISGSTVGIGFDLGYDFMITDRWGLGVGMLSYLGIPFKADAIPTNPAFHGELGKTEVIPIQMNFNAGIRYYL